MKLHYLLIFSIVTSTGSNCSHAVSQGTSLHAAALAQYFPISTEEDPFTPQPVSPRSPLSLRSSLTDLIAAAGIIELQSAPTLPQLSSQTRRTVSITLPAEQASSLSRNNSSDSPRLAGSGRDTSVTPPANPLTDGTVQIFHQSIQRNKLLQKIHEISKIE